ncbi:agip159 [Agrotis ipsilon multiple nucleopolyhedrovirus]|uniref:Uncharacterized protein n=1 Tax=Agrotis ipsilon multiple nucleopolyhedrovirus TaxID=208013 RepID=B6D673_9ABAC|nr:agip159 [Agrotis ipsilon multiple nucleopolyhedrovirus]ACI28860.1 unknown [Agrotis ipsilon multiple nucleopolyhedrovirus]
MKGLVLIVALSGLTNDALPLPLGFPPPPPKLGELLFAPLLDWKSNMTRIMMTRPIRIVIMVLVFILLKLNPPPVVVVVAGRLMSIAAMEGVIYYVKSLSNVFLTHGFFK